MFGSITFGILLSFAIITFLRSCAAHVDGPDLASQAGTVLGLAFAFFASLVKTNLKAYFWWQRMRLRFDTRNVCRLSLTARIDGTFNDGLIRDLVTFLCSQEGWTRPAKLQFEKATEALLYIPEGLYLSLNLERREYSVDGKSHLQLSSGMMELPVVYAAKKVEREILPLISSVRQKLDVGTACFALELSFQTQNPFFALYVAHLDPEQVGDFRVVLKAEPKQEHASRDTVEIRKEKVIITAASSEGIAKLARDFILLSPDLDVLRS